MTFRSIFVIGASVFLLLGKPAYAIECIVIGPRYGLTSDTVNWSVKIRSGQSCTRSLRFDNVEIESLELVSPPQHGKVALQGPSFTYSASSEYSGEDSFTIAASGKINRSSGNSTIRIIVSAGNSASAAIYKNRTPEAVAAPTPLVTTPVDNNLPLPDNASLLPCPRWDWSTGSPPPMRPPFDRSKLYCPPPPFKPQNQPVGCRCEE